MTLPQDNPMVALVMETRDGTRLRWKMPYPIKQSDAMMAFGRMFARLKLPEMPELELPKEDEP